MRCEHDTRTLELPGLGEPAKPASAPPVRAGRGAYKVKMTANSHAMRRVAAGLTMKELAKRAGVSLRTIERLEGYSGCDISRESRRAIRDALDQAEAKQ